METISQAALIYAGGFQICLLSLLFLTLCMSTLFLSFPDSMKIVGHDGHKRQTANIKGFDHSQGITRGLKTQ